MGLVCRIPQSLARVNTNSTPLLTRYWNIWHCVAHCSNYLFFPLSSLPFSQYLLKNVFAEPKNRNAKSVLNVQRDGRLPSSCWPWRLRWRWGNESRKLRLASWLILTQMHTVSAKNCTFERKFSCKEIISHSYASNGWRKIIQNFCWSQLKKIMFRHFLQYIKELNRFACVLNKYNICKKLSNESLARFK